MKGHLSVKELERWRKADLQKLAHDMGVSDEGTIKEIAARCAAVEVDVPDEELLEEEKAELEKEQAAADQKKTAEKAKRESERHREELEKAAGRVKVKATVRYKDKRLGQIKEAGECFYVDRDRAEELLQAGVVSVEK